MCRPKFQNWTRTWHPQHTGGQTPTWRWQQSLPICPPRYNYDNLTNKNGSQILPGGDSIPSPKCLLRHNYDNITNKKHMQLCHTLGLYIVNGRLRGDSYGRYTYSSSLGSSTVDYFITDLNPESLKSVHSQLTDTPIRPQQNPRQLPGQNVSLQ